MTGQAQVERGLTEWFSSDASVHTPIDLHASAMARVRRARQRPALIVMLRGDRLSGADRSLDRVRTLVLVGAALLLVAFAAVLVAGAMRPDVVPRGSSGWITYVSQDYSISDESLPPAWSIWRVRADGSGDQQIGFGECPSLSADGSSMVFVSGRLGNVKGQMIAAKGDGSKQHVLPGIAAWSGEISPDGSQVAWVKDVGSSTSPATENNVGFVADELWVSPVSGSSGVRIVARDATPNVSYVSQAWSPAGDQIAFVVEDNVRFSGPNEYTGEASIWIVNADGSELHQLATASPGTSISWSPDGRWLAYVRDSETGPQLMSQAADGSVERLIAAEYEPTDPRWSPDGAYLAFLDHRDGVGTVVTVEMSDGSPVSAPHRGPAATEATFGFDIAWSPDSHNLLIVETRRIKPGSRAESFASRLLSTDPEFRGEPALLLERGRSIGDFQGCPVTWSNP